MGIESVESTGPRNVEIGLRSLDQEKAIALEGSDEDKLLGDLTRHCRPVMRSLVIDYAFNERDLRVKKDVAT